MDKLKNNPLITSLLLITVIPMLAYLPLIPFMGFYSEDIFYDYVGHFYGQKGIVESLSIDRPFMGYLLSLSYSLLGDKVILWHICMFLLRIAGGYLLFFFLIKLWPNRLSAITITTLFFLIYPGFLQQTLPLGYQTYPIALIFWISSVILTLFAVRKQGKLWQLLLTSIAILLQIFTLLTIEFFIGMELLRFLIITLYLKGDISFRPIKTTLAYWSPYIISSACFILWRIFIFKSTREVTDINWIAQTYYTDPSWIVKIPLEIIHSLISTIILPYFLPIAIRIPRIPLESTTISLLLGTISGALVYLYYKMIEKSKIEKNLENSYDIKKFGGKLVIIGTVSILAALIPIIISGRFVRLYNVYDRYTITSIIGVSFLLIGLSYKISASLRHWIVILIVSVSITTHVTNGYLFATNWHKQRDLWWQLYWRAPNIENNAMLILDFPPVTEKILFKDIINKVQWYRFYWVEEQIWAPGNLFFNYDRPTKDHLWGDFLPDKNVTDKIKSKTVETFKYVSTSITLTKNYNNTVIISAGGNQSCLWVLDKTRQELPENSNNLLKSSIIFSDIDKLVNDDTFINPPTSIFGNEPTRNWCYFFQKASLYRQLKDWGKLTRLTQEVLEKNLKPKDVNEWSPFIEGLIVSKKYSEAEDLIKIAYKDSGGSITFTTNLCKMTDRLQTTKFQIYCRS